jgi:signal transduction histidine kinase/ActR/RegA family two-component response regulator
MRWKFIDRLLLPTIFGLATVLAALVLWELLIFHLRAETQAATNEQVQFVKTKTESELKARILPLERLAGRWQARGQPDDLDMESDAGLVMSVDPSFQAIEWVDPTLHLRWVTPRSSREAELGADFGSDERRRVALSAAQAGGLAMVTRPLDLRQGGRGLLVCVPVYSEGKLSGFLLGVFRYQELLSSILQNVAQDYWVAVYDNEEEIYGRGDVRSSSLGAWAQEGNIQFQQLTWRARLWPKPGTLSYAGSPLPQVFLIGGILMACLLAFTVYMAETARLHAKEVVATNKELKREIAGREQAEEALRQAQKMEAVGRLAGGVAHDFNNLLMVIRGHAALSLNRTGSNDALRRELNEILKSTDRASSLTRQLLAFSRNQVLQLRVLDLNSLVTQVKELLPPVLGEDIHLVMDLDSELGRVKADSAQMEQVIMNLVFNARDAMPGGGELTIQTANYDLDESWVRRQTGVRAGPHVMLAVRDTGQGMNEEVQSHIFEPFFTTKDRGKGTGLGLASVYGTVRQSGGFITVSSKLHEGTTIQIYLPRVEGTVEASEVPKALPRSRRGDETILVVEDDDAVRRMTREFLKIKGYTVVEARSAADAIQFMERHNESVDLVLTDVLMPGMKGRELVERLEKLRSGMKVLYMSAYTEDAAINIGVLNPGTEFIEKPFGPEELADKVREVLGANRETLDA